MLELLLTVFATQVHPTYLCYTSGGLKAQNKAGGSFSESRSGLLKIEIFCTP